MDRLYNKEFFLNGQNGCNVTMKILTNFYPSFAERAGASFPSRTLTPPPCAHTHLKPVDLGLGLRPSSSLSTFHFPPLALKLIKNPDSKATAY